MKWLKSAMLLCCLFGRQTVGGAADATPELLWPAGAPGAKGTGPHDQPRMTYFPAAEDKAVGACVLVFPGGGYGALMTGYEGRDACLWFNARGISSVLVEYRLGSKGYQHPAPLLDAQRALRITRSRAAQWNIDPGKIGVLGFSAGGHLAATIATHFDAGNPDATDPIERIGCRPDFAVLCYPVISMTDITHGGSKKNLLGENPTQEQIDLLSNEKQVTAETPPTFMFHTNADTAVVAENSVAFYLALRKHKVPAELHIYEIGNHGVGLAAKNPLLSNWTGRLEDWLKVRKVLK